MRQSASILICVTLACVLSNVHAGEEFQEMTDESTHAAERAMKWLLKAQNRDGSWGLDANSPGDITCTALACLALIESGYTEREGTEATSVNALRRGTEYILNAAKKAHGDIEMSETTLIQYKLGRRVHNFFGVILLTQIYGMRPGGLGSDTNEDMKNIIQKLTDIIAGSQEPDGSWHKQTWGSLKATGMAWLALRSAASTGVPIKHAAVDKTVKFIKGQYNPSNKLYDGGNAMGGYQSLYSTATCVRVMVGMGEGQDQHTLEAIDQFTKNVKSGEWSNMYLTVEGEDYLSALIMTHSLIQHEGERWRTWFTFIRSALCKRQNADGSWTTTACITGKTFPTACALLTLTAPNRLTPIQQ
jgi:hypothetical protein